MTTTSGISRRFLPLYFRLFFIDFHAPSPTTLHFAPNGKDNEIKYTLGDNWELGSLIVVRYAAFPPRFASFTRHVINYYVSTTIDESKRIKVVAISRSVNFCLREAGYLYLYPSIR